MYELICKIAENPCPLDQQLAMNDAVFTISSADCALAFATGFGFVFGPIVTAYMAGALLRMIDPR